MAIQRAPSRTLSRMRLVVFAAAVLAPMAQAQESSSLSSKAGDAGTAVGSAVHQIGQTGKHIGLTVGSEGKRVGLEIGHAAKSGGLAFWHAVKGEKN